MTLGRLVLAWLPVAVWFVVATYAIPPLVGSASRPPDQPGVGPPVASPLLTWRLVEAGLLTLFASLWFDSLGSGGWWLLFLLVGAIATIPLWLSPRAADLPRRARVVGACADLARYVVAGGILAWRLG
ncbi:MAG TPA: hypothetical protein VFI66_00545 [Gemmatimonadales bacterium]|nr:hypothetical protein [Gemmatimonadales bacterium]